MGLLTAFLQLSLISIFEKISAACATCPHGRTFGRVHPSRNAASPNLWIISAPGARCLPFTRCRPVTSDAVNKPHGRPQTSSEPSFATLPRRSRVEMMVSRV